jgi:hypothetical protein
MITLSPQKAMKTRNIDNYDASIAVKMPMAVVQFAFLIILAMYRIYLIIVSIPINYQIEYCIVAIPLLLAYLVKVVKLEVKI